MKADIQTINAEDTWPIRQRVFWPDQPISQGVLEDDDQGLHFGVFVHERLVSVGSLFPQGDSIRLRKLATIEDYQKLGLGSRLIEYLIDYARQQGYKTLWCSVHESSLPYYQNFGFERSDEPTVHKGSESYCRIVLIL